MARSSAIWIVDWNGNVQAAFTVKKELCRWLEDDPNPEYRIWRHVDSPIGRDFDLQRFTREELATWYRRYK
jgi:hypothetical protein